MWINNHEDIHNSLLSKLTSHTNVSKIYEMKLIIYVYALDF